MMYKKTPHNKYDDPISTTRAEWMTQRHGIDNTGLPDHGLAHPACDPSIPQRSLEMQQQKARETLRCVMDEMPGEPESQYGPEPEGDGDYTAWPMTPGCRMQIF